MSRRSIDWSFDGTWPWQPRWFPSDDGPMHYVDEGPSDGRPVVLVHGNPTWGYLYRKFIPALVAAGHRVIVPDHLGFGRSAKPSSPGVYQVDRHAARFASLLNSLELEEAVLVPHDWGGPISLSWAGLNPDRIAALFILNTLAHPVAAGNLPGVEKLKIPAPLRLFRSPGVGELLVQGFDAFKPVMFRLAIEDRDRMTDSDRRAYRAPHPGWRERAAMLAFARQLPTGPGDPVNAMNSATEALLSTHFRSKPAKVVWGEKDLVLPAEMIELAWLNTLPDAEVLRLPEAGHFVQEDAPAAVVRELTAFIEAI